MAITIAQYCENHVPAVVRFNRRLRDAGMPADYVFSESPVSAWLPYASASPVYNEFYLAVGDDGEVRGTFALKHQHFAFHGEVHPVTYYHHPFSEGLIDKAYAGIGTQMLMHVIRRHPMLYALGMGGYDRPLPRMLTALKWQHCLLPFYFHVNNTTRFLDNIGFLRASRARRVAGRAAIMTGTGWAAIKSAQRILQLRSPKTDASSVVVDHFADWADSIWRKCSPEYAMAAVRDASSLRTLYPAENPLFTKIRVMRRGETIGWAVAAESQHVSREHYGEMRVGNILDAFAMPGDAPAVICLAKKALLDRGVDVIVSNQSHSAWCMALKQCGFFTGPSNFIFATAPTLSKRLMPFLSAVQASHINRGDGDNLLQFVCQH